MFVVETSVTIESMRETAVRIASAETFQSYGVRARRQHKQFAYTSQEISRIIGDAIGEQHTYATVDLTHPDIFFYVTLVDGHAFIGCKRYEGLGGLPIGVSGKVLVMLSGGIDSPVAASLLQKRGCPVEFIHFHNIPYTSPAGVEKARSLAKHITANQSSLSRLFLVPFTSIQQEIVKHCDQSMRILLYRRCMLKIAQRVAERYNILLLATGDSISQVASQTIENIAATDEAVSMTILRPLSGYDKLEIITIAQKIGTFAESSLPHQDCCSYFMPRNPQTHATALQLREQEQSLHIDELVTQAIDKLEIIVL